MQQIKMWTPFNATKYGIVVCNFAGNQIKHGLTLCIGDAVQIFEECQGWYRGCLLSKKGINGIFPAKYVHLKECKSDVPGPNATVTPLEDPVAREVVYILREWALLWKKLYIEDGQTELFDTVHDVMRDLAQLRKELLTHTLTQEQVAENKGSIVSKIDWGNKRLNLDLVPRIKHEPVDADLLSPVQLYRLHEESLKSYTGAGSRGSVRSVRSIADAPGKWKTSSLHHLLLHVKNFACNVGEHTELHFRLYDAKDNTFFSEKFLSVLTKNGLPVKIDKLHHNFGLFTDLGGTDLLRDAYLVVHVYKIATLLEGQTKKSSKLATYKRPYGVGAHAINSILMASTEETELTLKICQVSNENDFHLLHESIIRKQNTKFQLPSNTMQPGIAVGCRMLHGELESVLKEDPLQSKFYAITRKIGFAEIIMPGDVRNDLYVTLIKGTLNKGSKYSDMNIEIKVSVYDAAGQPLWHCIYPGAGEEAVSYYASVVFYHSNSPHWNDTIKMDIPIEFYLMAGSHLRFEFRHCSTKPSNKEKRLLGFCFLPLVSEDGTTLQNGTHELFFYKCDDLNKLSDPNKYLTLLSRTSQVKPETGGTQGNTFFKRSEKEREKVEISTMLCSTKLTQNADLLAVLRWKENKDNLEHILERLMAVDGQEIIQYLQDILDALFTMFESNGGKRIKESHKLFQALCHIFILVSSNRYEHFKPVLDSYVTNHFSAVLACRDLLLCLTEVLTHAAGLDDHHQSEECLQKLQGSNNVIEYIVKFIVQGRKLLIKTRETMHEVVFREFSAMSSNLFDSMQKMLTIPYEDIENSQILLLDSLPKVFSSYQDVIPSPNLCERFIRIMSSIPSEMCDKIHHRKMRCLKATVNSTLFDSQECRDLLVPLFAQELVTYIVNIQEMKQCAELLGDILIRLHDDHSKTKACDVRNVSCLLKEALEPIIFRLLQEERNMSILSHLVASVVALLRMMETDARLYNGLLANFSNLTSRRDMLVRVLRLFERMVEDDVYPPDWMVMRQSQNQVILSTLQFVSQTMLDDYRSTAIDFEFELWERYFQLAVSFLTQPSLQLEHFSEAKRQKMKEKYGDMRVRMGYEILSMWDNLAVHKLHFVPTLVGPFLEVTLIPETELRKATIPIFFDMMQCERRVYHNFKEVEAELIDKLDILINESKGDEEYKQLFNSILLEKVKAEPDWDEGVTFVKSVTRLLENLLDYR